MAQAGYTPIQLYFSTTAAAVPTSGNLANGELGINIQDEKLYFKNAAGTVKLLASNATSAPVLTFSAGTTGFTPNTATSGAITLAGTLGTANGGTNLGGATPFTSGGVVYASSTSALATGSALTFDGTNLGVSGNANFGNSGSSSYGGYATGGRIFSLAAAGGVIPAISASTDTFAASTAIRAYTKEVANDTSYAFDIQTGNGSGVTTQKLQLTWGANGLWNSTALSVTGNINSTNTIKSGSGSGETLTTGSVDVGKDIGLADGQGVVTGGSRLITVRTAGYVGIGQSNPLSRLSILGTTSSYGVTSVNPSGYGAFNLSSTTIPAQAWSFIANDNGANSDLAIYGGAAAGIQATISSSGNFGLGVSPSAWASPYKAIQLGLGVGVGGIFGRTDNINQLIMGLNWTYTGGASRKYIASSYSTSYEQDAGNHIWYSAASGTAGANISFNQSMTLDPAGRLLIGGTSTYDFNGQANLVVNGTANLATIVVASTDAGYIAFADGTSGTARYAGNILYSHTTNAMSFGTDGVFNRVTIGSNGSLSIGTSGETIRLAMEGTIADSTYPLIKGTVKAPYTGGWGSLAPETTIGGYQLFTYRNETGEINKSSAIEVYLANNTYGAGITGMRFITGGYNATNGAEAMRITEINNVGIGTNNPTARLAVELINATAYANTAPAQSNCTAAFLNTSGHTTGGTFVGYQLNISGNSQNRIGYIGAITDSTSNQALSLVFGTNTAAGDRSEKMRLDSSGNLLVGTTTAGAGLGYPTMLAVDGGGSEASVFKTSAGASAHCSRMWNSATSGDNCFIAFQTEAGGTQRGSITYNRTAGLTAYNTTSDYRAKDIIGPVTNSGSLIDSVPVYMGKMKDATQERPMFIAHEVPAYAHTGEKDAVDKDGKPVYQQMDASALIPVMWAEIQSLRKRLADAGI
jgi:hypothetical protein